MQFRLRFLQAKLADQFLISFNSSNIDYKPYGKAPSSGARLAIHTIFELAGERMFVATRTNVRNGAARGLSVFLVVGLEKQALQRRIDAGTFGPLLTSEDNTTEVSFA